MVSTEGRIKIMNWVNSKRDYLHLLSSTDHPFIGSLGCFSIQECWKRIATGPNFVCFLLEALSSSFPGLYFSGCGSSLHRVQRPVFALYCTCCDWNLPQSAMRISCKRPSHLITGLSSLKRRRHTIPQSYPKTELYEPQHGHFQAHNFTYLLSAGHSVLECKITTVMESAERAWITLSIHENQPLHCHFEFCKLIAISHLGTLPLCMEMANF
jgi:hypothetical protein